MAKIPKGGMYGAAVFTVVLVAAMFIVFLSDVQEETKDVIKYDYVTDITGLFTSDESPQYFEYDLAQSYTGYYTDDSSPYFGGVTAVTTAGQTIYDGMTDNINSSGKVNSYRLNLENDISYDSANGELNSGDFGTDASTPPGSRKFVFCDYGSSGTSGIINYYKLNYFEDSHVENLGSSYTSDSDFGQVLQSTYIYHYDQSTGSYTGALTHLWSEINATHLDGKIIIEGTSGSGVHNRFFIGSVSDYLYHNSGGNYTVAYCEKDYYDSVQVKPTYTNDCFNTAVTAPIAAHSCIIDMTTGTVELYSGYTVSTNSVPIRTIELEDAMIIYGFDTYSNNAFTMGYDTPLHYEAYTDVYAYLNPNVGVRVTSL